MIVLQVIGYPIPAGDHNLSLRIIRFQFINDSIVIVKTAVAEKSVNDTRQTK